MSFIRPIRASDVVLLLIALWLLLRLARGLRRRVNTTSLKGPASKSLLFGISQFLGESKDSAAVYEDWAEKYGLVFRIPIALGGNRIYILDPKAIAHITSRDTSRYIRTSLSRAFVKNLVGRGVLWAEGESHKRQRRALAPAFSITAIRKLTHVFFDSAYKVKDAWDAILESSPDGEAVIEVQNWMNRVSLDSMGIAGFSHDFGTLSGKRAAISDVFESFATLETSLVQMFVFIIGVTFPILTQVPTKRRQLVQMFSSSAEEISKELLNKTRIEKEGNVAEEKGDRSVIGLLIKAEANKTELRMSEEEVMAQMKILIFAGYETTSISLTWTLIELAKNPSIQTKLRDELISHFRTSGDPTYDDFNALHYLDAVVQETLRLHAAVPELTRVALEDDVIPLSAPIQIADNRTVDHISIAAGQFITIPIIAMQRCTSIWGPDAHEFKPERWLDNGGIPSKAKEFQGYRHLFTFWDGPKTCLGKNFASAELKATLSVLIRNYVVELQDGPDTQFEQMRAMLPRPKVVGEDGCSVPLRIRRFE